MKMSQETVYTSKKIGHTTYKNPARVTTFPTFEHNEAYKTTY